MHFSCHMPIVEGLFFPWCVHVILINIKATYKYSFGKDRTQSASKCLWQRCPDCQVLQATIQHVHLAESPSLPSESLSHPASPHCPNTDVPPDTDTIPLCFPQIPPTSWILQCLLQTPTNSLGHLTLLLLAHHLCCVSLLVPAWGHWGRQHQQQQAQAAAAPPAPAMPPAAPSECHMAQACSAICWLLAHHGASWAGERQAHVNHPSCLLQASMNKVAFLPATHISHPLVWPAVLPRSGTSGVRKWEHAGGNGNPNCVWITHPVLWDVMCHRGRLPLKVRSFLHLEKTLSALCPADMISTLGTGKEFGCLKFLLFPDPLAALVLPQ